MTWHRQLLGPLWRFYQHVRVLGVRVFSVAVEGLVAALLTAEWTDLLGAAVEIYSPADVAVVLLESGEHSALLGLIDEIAVVERDEFARAQFWDLLHY